MTVTVTITGETFADVKRQLDDVYPALSPAPTPAFPEPSPTAASSTAAPAEVADPVPPAAPAATPWTPPPS